MSASNELREYLLSNQTLLNLLEEAYTGGNWFQFPLPFLDIMSHHETLLFCYLQNHARKNKKHGSWFYCYAEQICKDLRLSMDQQTQWIRKLVNKEFIKIRWEKETIPSRRLFWINWEKVAQELLKTQPLREQHLSEEETAQERRFRKWDEEADNFTPVHKS